MDWRDDERLRVVEHFADKLHELNQLIDTALRQMTLKDWLWRSSYHDEHVAPIVEDWMKRHYSQLRENYEASAKHLEDQLVQQSADHSWSMGEIASAGVTAAVSVAPLAVIPFVAGLATVTTTTLLVFTTSAISLPALALLGGGLAIATFGSSSFRNQQLENLTCMYIEQVQSEARNKIIGDVADPDTPSVQRCLLAEIDQIALKKQETLT
ncbi:hypothetical protein [Shimia abyssi]|nr:hypothetical protein [Shimia abyssi]